jgi:hypothetical protein
MNFYHTRPNNPEVKNGIVLYIYIYIYIYIFPHTSSWRGTKLIKYRDNFTFYFSSVGGQSSWLQIHRSGFDSRHYQIS